MNWCGRRDLNPQAFWAPAPKAGVFAISPLPHGSAQAGPAPFKSKSILRNTVMSLRNATPTCIRAAETHIEARLGWGTRNSTSLDHSSFAKNLRSCRRTLDSSRMSRMTMALSSALVMS